MPTTTTTSQGRQHLADHLHTATTTGRPVHVVRYRETLAALVPIRHRAVQDHPDEINAAPEVSVRQARKDWGALLKAAAAGTPTVITSNRRRTAALIPPDWV